MLSHPYVSLRLGVAARFPIWFTRGVEHLQTTNATMKVGAYHVVRSGNYKGQHEAYVHNKDNCTADSCSALGLLSLIVTVTSPRRTSAKIQIAGSDVLDAVVKATASGAVDIKLGAGKVLHVDAGFLDSAELTSLLEEHELTTRLAH